MPERRYLFKHALAPDAAYESVLECQRAALHAKVAEHLATAYLTMVRAFAYLTEGDHARATDWARRALRLAEEGRDTLERGASHRVLGQALEVSGQRAQSFHDDTYQYLIGLGVVDI